MKDFKLAAEIVKLIEAEYDIQLSVKPQIGRQTKLHGEARRIFCYIVSQHTNLAVRQYMTLIGVKNHSSVMAIKREWKEGKLDRLKTEINYFENLLKQTYETVH